MRARRPTTILSLAVGLVIAAAVFATAASAASPLSPEGGCDTGTTANGVTTIPIKVVKEGQEVEPLVSMCFDGKGPYPMLLDTGAEFSVIATELAKELGLKPVGSPLGVEGAGCTTKARGYELESATVGGVELEGGDVLTVAAPGKGPWAPRGSLGADILSRFGSAKIDFRNETLILGSEEEGPRFNKATDPPPVPGALLKRKPEVTVPMRVEAGPMGVSQTVKVGVGSTKPRPWLIDTGSSASLIEPQIVKRAGLKATGTAQESHTYCSIVTVPEYQARSLSLGSAKLRTQRVASFKGAADGEGGILGAYSLWQYGSVVFDWPGGKLLLGVG
jgi:predicted aspartyl protease